MLLEDSWSSSGYGPDGGRGRTEVHQPEAFGRLSPDGHHELRMAVGTVHSLCFQGCGGFHAISFLARKKTDLFGDSVLCHVELCHRWNVNLDGLPQLRASSRVYTNVSKTGSTRSNWNWIPSQSGLDMKPASELNHSNWTT
uniref:Homocitrate synthase n=1 Tax=Anthurium amnicola TaxID=1678845 RepID=A0A1D1YZH2_9ARAE